MGGQQTQQSQSTSQTQLPQWVQDAGYANFKSAKNVATTPYDSARDTTVAPQSPLTTAGYSAVANGVGQAQPLIQAGAGAYGSTAGYQAPTVNANNVTSGLLSSTSLTPYMNPFTQSVIDATNATSKNALDQSLVGQDAAATAAKAFGGSRAANADAVLRAQYAIGAGNTAANLNSANFTQAQNAANTDIANRLQADTGNANRALSADQGNQSAAAQAANIRQGAGAGLLSAGSALQTANTNDASNLLSAGANQQAYTQSVNDATTANAQKRYQQLVDNVNLKSSTLGLTPYNTTTSNSGTATTESSPDFATALLGGAKLLGLGGSGGLLSGLGGLFK